MAPLFKCPVIIRQLNRRYKKNKIQQQNIKIRESEDVLKFLRAKAEFDKNTRLDIVFK
jgi:hypothetical protein